MRGALALTFAGLAGGAAITYPTVLEAAEGVVHPLAIEHVPFGNYGFNTRGFNGGIPGPTFRMKPGETLRIDFTNNLSAANNVACPDTAGEFCESATSNLHTHGLHISSKGKEDGLAHYSDDVFADVLPGETETYSFTIPENHMGGTHWYHPHHHHATAIQAGGGAAGVLIVDDPEGYLPPEYANMSEHILFISGHNLANLADIAARAQSTILEGALNAANTANLAANVFFVNGQALPTLTLESHTWHRLRMAYAAVEQGLALQVTGDATCTLKLLAKDGIYVTDLPRDIATVMLFPGARADVAVSCTCTAYPCTGMLASNAGRRLQPGRGRGGGPGANDMVAADLLELSITQGPSTSVVALPATSVQRPCYLVDLRSAAVPDAQSKRLALNGGGRTVTVDGQGASMTYANTHANGGTMATWPALTTFPVGSVHELQVTGVGAHPLHLHVVPFQITAMPAAEYSGGFFKVGDWHDTLMIMEMAGGPGGQVTIRQQTDKFTGKMVVHCHILEHEDEGMMGFIDISGTEGTIYADAATLDSTCYAAAFNNTGTWATPATVDANAGDAGDAANSAVSHGPTVTAAMLGAMAGLSYF
mmetsp:Transcript_1918/g.5640  ORF Transcript_1918/g.5640 Transcript_1918/m.5640 type:complete len:593 (-) Transcript_1918:67-1845(-)